MAAPDGIAAALSGLPRGDELVGLRRQVAGAPASIRKVATRWRTTANAAIELVSGLNTTVIDVDNAWQGASADTFRGYMRTYDRACDGFRDALVSCANSLDAVAARLEEASSTVDNICGNLLNRVETHRRNNPDREQRDLDQDFGPWVETAISDAHSAIGPASDAVTLATTTLEKHTEDELAHFSLVRSPGSDASIPTSGWERTPGYQPPTGIRALGDSGGYGGNGGNGSEGGYGPVGHSGTSPGGGGGTPAPKKEVVEWIREALTILRDNGVAVNPDDPATIDKIWTIIFHESGGNPQAINNWDSNAAAGIPSKGLMQTIDPTFQAHKQPGYDDVWNPVHNIMAGVRYTISRYGSLDGHPGLKSLSEDGGYKPY
ncbi:transglycosylase SLT domain-containing protein [Streptosporangium sp. NPDC005286]|uniref:transglycosylase SLT domain-containing protein n=1 Tax=Streptosporangium sp. NPDC005286 TaxID=3154463 RepID=UPI0033B5E8C4